MFSFRRSARFNKVRLHHNKKTVTASLETSNVNFFLLFKLRNAYMFVHIVLVPEVFIHICGVLQILVYNTSSKFPLYLV